MTEKETLRQSVYLILKERGKPISFDEIWNSLENNEDIQSSTLGSLLASDDMFLRWESDTWGLKAWLINGIKFRVYPGEKELSQGYFTVNYELVLFFPTHTTSDISLKLFDKEDKEFDVIFSPSKRRVEGMLPIYESLGTSLGDDLIVKVLDADLNHYRVTSERAEDKDKEAVNKLNKRIADIAYEVFPDDGYAMLSNILSSILFKIDLKGQYPPDRLPRILEQDLRFRKDPDYGLFQLSGRRSMLLDAMSDGNRVRAIIDRYRDPGKALREILGGTLELDDCEEAEKLLEQFMALWNMLKVSNANFR